MNARVEPLHRVATIERDGVAPGDIEDGSLYVGLENIASDGGFVNVAPVQRGDLASQKFRFDERHILYGKLRPYLSKIARPTFAGICSTDIVPLLPGPEMDQRFLLHYLRTPKMVELATRQSAGANLPRLSPTLLEQFPVPVPSPREQRRIADILDKAEAIRRKRKAAIVLTEDLLRSTFLEMFGDPVTNPKRWPTETIADLCERGASLVDGPFGSSLKPDQYVTAGAKVVRNWNIYDDQFDTSAFKYVTAAKFGELRRSEVLTGDVLITTKGTVGDVCLAPDLDGPALLSASGTVRLRVPPDRTYHPAFLVAQMITPSFKRYLHKFEAGSAQQYLNLSAIKKMQIVRPPIGLQTTFVDLRAQAKIARIAASDACATSDALFRSLAERAFAGGLT